MNKPKIIFIDWFGTLSKSKFWEHLEKTDKDLFTLIERNLFKKNSDLIGPWMRGKLTSEDIANKIAQELNIDYKKIFRDLIKSSQNMQFVSSKVPKLIKRIRKNGTKVYIATDNMDTFDRWTVPSMNLYGLFDDILNSFSTKALKHDFDEKGNSLFFDTIFFREKVLPSETILIDDSEDKGNLLTNYGIGYRRILENNSLVEELEKYT